MSFLAKSVILDIADNWGDAYLGLRSVDFLLASVKEPVTESNATGYATTYYGGYTAIKAFDTSLSKLDAGYFEWLTTSANTNQRLICVFATPVEFDEVVINNSHSNGGFTTRGVKNVRVNISTDAITDTTYNAAIANATEIYNGQFGEHIASNVEDPETLVLIPIDTLALPALASSGELAADLA
ncbi:MAG: hypothetical protein P1P81_04395, partial [Desulfobulbales bacterium]|nr:hypothetical protein [Desulfobulbales bacterium]